MTRYVPMTESLRLCALGAAEAGAGSMKESRRYRGFDPDGVAEIEADHSGNCPIRQRTRL
jgi:hypothetical protein